ncbi:MULTISPECIES: DUF6966 domain-containing protein [Streptacidiphilus]|uniref:DUF6966 domain-containing protein n=2 Tax=Streptacidiphilus TaxID=228398 RepID=A0ABV6UUA8_9ACTN|nr:hypothetical protein [Streptacidiphilus jeojiense]
MANSASGLMIKLDEFMQALTECGFQGWADWMELAKGEIAAGDLHGIERVLGAYGGMGSISDLPLAYDHRVMVLSAEVHSLASWMNSGRR